MSQTQNMCYVDILMTITLKVNMITRQVTPFFSNTLWTLSFGIFHFCNSWSSWGPPLYYILVCKMHIYMLIQDNTFKPVNIDTLFLQKSCQYLLYIACFVSNLMPILLWSYRLKGKLIVCWQTNVLILLSLCHNLECFCNE